MTYNSRLLLSRPWVCTSAADRRWLPWAPALTDLGFFWWLGFGLCVPSGAQAEGAAAIQGKLFHG